MLYLGLKVMQLALRVKAGKFRRQAVSGSIITWSLAALEVRSSTDSQIVAQLS